MKNIYLILILFLSILCFSQKQKCTIYLLDGTSKEGISIFKADDNVKFRETEDSKPEIILKEKIDKIKLDENGIIGTYRYKNVKDEGGLWLKESTTTGEVFLYTNKISGVFYGGGVGFNSVGGVGMSGGMMMGSGGDVIYYYVCHKTDTEVFKITSTGNISKNFKNAASEFFKDCPKLVEKIQTKEYKKNDIESVVWFYNNYCGTK